MSLPPVPKNWNWAKGTPAGGLHAWLNQLRGKVGEIESRSGTSVTDNGNGTATLDEAPETDSGRVWMQDTPPPAGTFYRWTGTPHESTSEKVDGVVVATNLALRTQGTAGSFVNNNDDENITERGVELPAPAPAQGITTCAQSRPTGSIPSQIASWYDIDGLQSNAGVERGFGMWVYTNEPDVQVQTWHIHDEPAPGTQRTVPVNQWLFIRAVGLGSGHVLALATKRNEEPVSEEGRFWATGVISLEGAEPAGFFDGDSPDDRANDLWINTAEGNKPYIWDSLTNEWVPA